MKRHLVVLACAVFAASLVACGGSSGSSSSSSFSTSDDDLTSAEVNAISRALTQATNDVGDSMSQDAGADLSAKTHYPVTVNTETSCPIAGHITSSGNIDIYVNDDTGESRTSGQITFQVSDPTNNLNDCEVAQDVILDGTLYLTISGNDSNITMTLDGIIGINERGEYGGLIPLTSDCRIYLYYSGGSASGTICGHVVST